jgi:long-chain alkane monooxygenase
MLQAGTSARGQAVAARHADASIVGRETPGELPRCSEAFKARLGPLGRKPHACQRVCLATPILGDTDEAAPPRADARHAPAPVEAGLAALSTLLPRALSPDALEPSLPAALQRRATPGIRRHLDPFSGPGRPPTLREIATRQVRLDSRPCVGTPPRGADRLVRTLEAVGGDGVALRQGRWPGDVGPFVAPVVPLLQPRGAVRVEYNVAIWGWKARG